MDKLPDYLIENYIIPYLSSYDLFYKFRALSPYYYYCSRNKILTHFPSEMMKTLKKIIDFNNKEDLTKKFDEITKKTFNDKRTLLILMIQMNVSLIVKKILETTRDERVIELISFLYVITKNEEKHNLMEQRNFDEIQRLSGEEEGVIEMRKKISDVLEEDDLDFDIYEYVTVYESLDREFLLSNDYTGALYNFIRLLIEFCGTKIRFNEIKEKLEIFFQQITEASNIWPKRRVFYEKSIDLIADTQILSSGAKKMLKLMQKYDIENELTDYNYEKEKINNYSAPEEFNVIKNNRKKLNMAVLRIHQMYFFFIRCVEYINKDKNGTNVDKKEEIVEIENDKVRFNVLGIIFEAGEFLYILSMIRRQYPINEQTFFITYNYLHYNIIHDIYNIDESKDSDKNDENEENNESNENKENNEIIENDENNKKKESNENNKNEENKNENKQCSFCRLMKNLNMKKKQNYSCSTQIDVEHLQGGIYDLEKVLEKTKMAGKEINDSFQKFSENLNNLNNAFTNNNNGEE